MIRVVLDTNILVSALLSPQGPPAQVFMIAILDPDTQLCVSGDIFAEYEEVIRRPRLRRSDSEIAAALASIRQNGFWVKPTEKVRACSDPNDNIFLECAHCPLLFVAHYFHPPAHNRSVKEPSPVGNYGIALRTAASPPIPNP